MNLHSRFNSHCCCIQVGIWCYIRLHVGMERFEIYTYSDTEKSSNHPHRIMFKVLKKLKAFLISTPHRTLELPYKY